MKEKIKHLLFVHLIPWVSSAVGDAKAWIGGIATVIGTAVYTSVQAGGLDITQALGWTGKQWVSYLAKVGIPAVLAFFVVGRPHQTAADIAAKLATLPDAQRAALKLGTDVPAAAAPPHDPQFPAA